MSKPRELAYNFLIRYRISTLTFNLDLLNEISIFNRWNLCPYYKNKTLIEELNLSENLNQDAFTYISNDDNNSKITVFYNDKLSDNDIIFNILHEFGHILLNHTTYNNVAGHSMLLETFKNQEDEANLFACEVLAPSCVFHQLNINNVDDIKNLSKLPYEHAKNHFSNITNFNSLDDISEKILDVFNSYIKKVKDKMNGNLSQDTKKLIEEAKEREALKTFYRRQEERQEHERIKNEMIKLKQEELNRKAKNKKLVIISSSTVIIIISLVLIFLMLNKNNKQQFLVDNTLVTTIETTQETQPITENTTETTTIQTETTSTNENIQTFYTTRTGNKYHTKNCHHIKDKSDLTEIKSNDTSFKRYTPCKVCIK